MNTETNTSKYVSDDLLISSFFLCRQVKLIDVISEFNHSRFVFENPTLCQQLTQEYLNNGTAPARELFARREELMSLMRNSNRYGENYDRRK